MKKHLVWGLLLSLFLTTGCAMFETPNSEKNAQQLADEGTTAFMAEDYKDAIKAYTDLKDWYPFSKYAILAELKIADAHFKLEEYDEAIAEYEEFERMHPRNEAIPYIINQIGLCWFNRMDSVDRDPAPSKNAMAQFERLLEQFPDSAEADKAGERIQKCLDNIAGHELYVADFYFKTKDFTAALKRYQYIVEFYPATQQAQRALAQIPLCTQALAKDAKNP